MVREHLDIISSNVYMGIDIKYGCVHDPFAARICPNLTLSNTKGQSFTNLRIIFVLVFSSEVYTMKILTTLEDKECRTKSRKTIL